MSGMSPLPGVAGRGRGGAQSGRPSEIIPRAKALGPAKII